MKMTKVWSSIPRANRRWIVVNALAVTAAINVVVNAAIAWLGTRGVQSVPLWSTPLSRQSTITDTLGTTFVLPLITAITTGVALRREIRRDSVLPLPLDGEAHRLVRRVPYGLVRRSLWIASATLVAVGPLALLLLVAAPFDDLSVPSFVLYKGAYAVGLGLVVTPIIALAAMTAEQASSPEQSRPG